jgi:hypothetical protein
MPKTRTATPREFEIRTENRYTLHPLDKKRCTVCEIVYDGIVDHFDIHHLKLDGTYSYAGQCKQCLAAIRADRTMTYKSDISLYVKRLLPAVRCRAKEVGVEFNLTPNALIEQWNRQHGLCYYTHIPMDLQATSASGKAPHHDFPSLDRKTPKDGYTVNNVVWTTFAVNRMKNDLTDNLFVELCRKVLTYHG